MDLEITKVPIIQITKGSSVIEVPSSNNEIGIASGTLRLKRSIVDTDIAFGEPIASEFSVELFNIEEDLQGCPIQVFLEDRSGTSYTRTAIFTGIIDSSKTDNIGHTRQIVAYDWIYYHRNDNVADWWNNYWQPATNYVLRTTRNAFIEHLGFTAPTQSFINDNNTYISWSTDDLPIVTTITVAQVLKMFCEMQGTFPYIDGSGNLNFAVLDNSITTDLRGEYESYNSNWEDFVTDTITGIAVYSSSEDLLTSVGTIDNVYNIAGNIWLMHLEEYYHQNVVDTLTRLLGVISNIQYKPCRLKMIKAHNGLVLGQRVQTDKGYTYVMSEELSGVCFVEQLIEGKASASKLPSEVSDANDTMVQENKLSKTYSEINQMKDRIVLKVDADGRIVQAELSADPSTGTEFKVSADNIDFIANGVMNLTANAIGINASNFSVDKDTGNITCNGGTIGGWRIYNTGFSYGMVSPSDYSHTGAFLDSTGSIIFSNVGNDNHTILNDEGLKVYKTSASNGELGSFTSNFGFVIPSGFSTRSFTGTAIVLGCSEDNTSTILNTELSLSPMGMTLEGASDIGYTDKGIHHYYGIYDDDWTGDTVPIILDGIHKQLVSSSVTSTELGYLSGATSNIQEQIDDATTITTKTDNEPYLSRSGVAIGDREYLDKLIGGTIAFNQLIQNGNFVDLTGWRTQQATLSVSNNVLTVLLNGNPWNQDILPNGWGWTFLANHKYIIHLGLQGTAGINNRNMTMYLNGAWTMNFEIHSTRTEYAIFYTRSSNASFTRFVFSGNASEFTGNSYMLDNFYVTDLTQMFGSTIADYVYSLGNTNGMAWLKSHGFFTKEYYPYTTGELVSVKPSAHRMLDASNNVLGEYPLANIDLRGLISLQNNKLVFSGDEYASDGTVTRKYGIVDLGSLTWSKSTSWASDKPYFYSNALSNLKVASNNSKINAISARYSVESMHDVRTDYIDKSICGYTSGGDNIFIIVDSSYTDASTLTTALNGVYIVYELVSQTTETVLPYTNPQICVENCVEEFIDTRDVPMPVGQNTEYIDIPDWMENRYFKDLRELPYEVDKITKEAHIYGVEWDGSSTTKWKRTDSSRFFPEPQPAVNNGNGFSPFDNIYPWAGMVAIDDATAGTIVSIPRFWYKWTKDGTKMKLQIADAPVEGFHVSPAHMDRGDGKGERKVVYVGRYHNASDYKSKTGVTPLGNKTRAEFRTGIHNLGSTIWQADFAMLWTIRMLYLVEFADWNSQECIGYGCGNNSSVQSVGASDNMKYHTGTAQASRTTYGVGVQYRHIEGLWDNAFDFWDGIYFSGTNVYGILNPSNFSDSANGVLLGTRPITDSYITAWNIPSVNNYDWALFPSAGNGSETTYVTDVVNNKSTGVVALTGGWYGRARYFGLFFSGGDASSSEKAAHLCSRLMVLP